MSATQRVTSPNFGPAATTRVSAGRNVAAISFPKVDELSATNPTGGSEQRFMYDEGFHESEHNRHQQQPQQRRGFTDFTSYAAVSYIDEVIAAQSINSFQPQMVFQSEIMRGVGRYESNLRVISGVDHLSGEAFNRVF
jgi:hypothetical protein